MCDACARKDEIIRALADRCAAQSEVLARTAQREQQKIEQPREIEHMCSENQRCHMLCLWLVLNLPNFQEPDELARQILDLARAIAMSDPPPTA